MARLKLAPLYKIVSRFSKRERAILSAASFVLTLTLLDRLVISPIFTELGELDKKLTEEKAKVKKSLRILSHKERIKKESAKYASFLESTKSEEEEMTILLKKIENIANESAVYLINMKPGGLKDLGLSKKYYINLNCEAQMEQLTDFMYKIESSDNLFSIEKYRINPKARESSVAKCGITITKIVIP